jgi:hypothetical protein
VARPEQQAKGGATGDPRAGRSNTRWRCKRPEGGARRAASPAGRQLCRGSAPMREGKRWPGLYSLARRRSRFSSVQSLQGHGMGEGGRRRARARRANGIRRWSSPASGGSPRGADHGPARVTHREGPTQRTDRRTLAVLDVRVRRTRQCADMAPGDVARRAFRMVSHFGLAPFDQGFLKFWQLKCIKKCIPKLYTSHPSTTFVKGVWGFSQPVVHKLYAKLAVFWAPVNSSPGH